MFGKSGKQYFNPKVAESHGDGMEGHEAIGGAGGGEGHHSFHVFHHPEHGTHSVHHHEGGTDHAEHASPEEAMEHGKSVMMGEGGMGEPDGDEAGGGEGPKMTAGKVRYADSGAY